MRQCGQKQRAREQSEMKKKKLWAQLLEAEGTTAPSLSSLSSSLSSLVLFVIPFFALTCSAILNTCTVL
jgi:hypothetical protein